MKFSYVRGFQKLLVTASLLFTFACQKHFVPVSHQAVQIQVDTTISADKEVEAFIAPYAKQLRDSMNTVIGHAAVEITKSPTESALGNFVADLTREYASAKLNKPVDMGAVTIGGLRINLAQGAITVGDIFELMPFENEIMVLTLKGESVKEMFDFLADRQILAVSNAKVIIENNKVKEILIGGKPLDVNKTYTLATSDYLAGGGDDMHFLKQALSKEPTDIKLRDSIINKIEAIAAKGERVNAKVEGRVVKK